MMDLEEETIAVGDTTPSFIEQARLHGWKAGLFDFGKAADGSNEFFNPGLVRRPDGLWLLVRASELQQGKPYGHNRIWACRLSEGLTPEGGPLLQFPDSGPEEQFEDPRAVYWNNQTWVGAVNFTWFEDSSWTGAHQVLGIFTNAGMQHHDDNRWSPLARRDPPIETNLDKAGDTNGRHNKNWVWFFHDGKLHLIYMSDPWHVVELGSSWDEQVHHKWDGVKWKFGTVRGGTPPVLGPDGRYYTFFHSSVPWRGRYRRYHMGAICFEAKAPFKPLLWTSQPLLSGSQNDPWGQRKPLVVFPCGSILEDDWWTITMGINDLRCGWVKIPHEDVVKFMQPAPEMPGLSLLADKTIRQQHNHVPFPSGGEADDGPRAMKEDDGSDLDSRNRDDGPMEISRSEGPPVTAGSSDRIYNPELLGSQPSWQTTGAAPQPAPAPVQHAPVQAPKFTIPPGGDEEPKRTPQEQEAINTRMAKMRLSLAVKKAAGEPLGKAKRKRKPLKSKR